MSPFGAQPAGRPASPYYFVGESGGYGMLIGPAATKAEIEDFRAALLATEPDESGWAVKPH